MLELGLELRRVQIAAKKELGRDLAVQRAAELENDRLHADLVALELVLEERLELGRDPLADPLELALGLLAIQKALDPPLSDLEEVVADGLSGIAKVGLEEDLPQAGAELDDEDLGKCHSRAPNL